MRIGKKDIHWTKLLPTLLCMTNKSQAKSIARCMAIHRAMDGAGDLFFMHNKIALAQYGWHHSLHEDE
jgi:hypothetical protein